MARAAIHKNFGKSIIFNFIFDVTANKTISGEVAFGIFELW